MKVNSYNNKGEKTTTTVVLDDSVFNVDVNESLLSQAVFVYLSNQRQANAHTKDRGAVSGGGKKPFKQKGTGRARAGSNRSPIWRGGGVTFGPTNNRNFKKKFSQKMTHVAMRSAFSKINKQNKLFVMEKFTPSKTKQVYDVVKALGLDGKLTFVQEKETGLYKSAKNLKDINVIRIGELCTYNILNAGSLVIFNDDLGIISKLWGK